MTIDQFSTMLQYTIINSTALILLTGAILGPKDFTLKDWLNKYPLLLVIFILNGLSYFMYNTTQQAMVGSIVGQLSYLMVILAICRPSLYEGIVKMCFSYLIVILYQIVLSIPFYFGGMVQHLFQNTPVGYLISLALISEIYLYYGLIKHFKKFRTVQVKPQSLHQQLIQLPLFMSFICISYMVDYGKAFKSDYFWDETKVFLMIEMFSIYVGLKCFNELKALLNQQQSELNQQITRSLIGEYLEKRHDIKNQLAVLESNHSQKNLVEVMWEEKEEELKLAGVQLIGQIDFSSVRYLTTAEVLSLATIVGILLDNAKEYLIQIPNLPQRVQVGGSSDQLFWINNPAAFEDQKKIKKFTKIGYTTKLGDVRAGYGLHNALQHGTRLGGTLKLAFIEEANQFSATMHFNNVSEVS